MKKLIIALFATSLAASAHAVIIGADIGYLTDAKEEYISARIGHAFKSDSSLSHQVELEIGFTSQKDSGIKGDFIPVTVNYRAETTTAEKLGFYYGVGVGFANTDVSGFGISDSGNSLTLQGFTGFSYKASDATTLHLGVKYIWIDDVKLLGTKVEVGDDIALTAGISVKF